jgi:hypothetical protein
MTNDCAREYLHFTDQSTNYPTSWSGIMEIDESFQSRTSFIDIQVQDLHD